MIYTTMIELELDRYRESSNKVYCSMDARVSE